MTCSFYEALVMEHKKTKELEETLEKLQNESMDVRLYFQRNLKAEREDIETLFRYMKFWGIHAILLNLVILGLMLCLILTN